MHICYKLMATIIIILEDHTNIDDKPCVKKYMTYKNQ